MKKLVFLFLVIAGVDVHAQTTQDTIDNPYWRTMMFDQSINIEKTRRAFDLYFSNKQKIKGTGHKQFERWYYFWRPKCDAAGNFPAPDRTINEYKKFLRNNLTARSASGNFTNLGPLVQPPSTTGIPIGTGRINAIGFHPINTNIIYCGAPQGGFWRSTDKGNTWVSSTDNLPTLGVSDIAVVSGTPNPTIFIGTGDRDAGDANGMGVYKSTDGGVSFTVSNTGMGNQTVSKIVANKLNESTMIAATSNGIYVSYNSGANWAVKAASGVKFFDVVYCPNDTNYVYATTANAFYRSTNGGSTWTSYGPGAIGFSSTAKNRMQVAVTAHNPNIVYVVASASSNLEAVYKSSDKGSSFVQKATTPNMLSGQGWYNIDIESSNTDSNMVYVGGLEVNKSTNGGATFTTITDWTGASADWVHADCHFLGRNPLNNELWIGTDGAVDYTSDEGNTFNHKDNGLAISQIYNIGVSQKSKTRFIVGLQDNGTLVGSSTSTWMARVGGDGMQCEISNLDTTKMFGNVQYGDLRRSTNGGTSWQDISATVPGGPGPWAAPCHLHPRLNDIMVMIYKNANLSKNVITAATPSFSAFTTGITSDGSSLRFSNKNDSLVFMGWSDGSFRYANILEPTPTVFSGTSPNGGNAIRDVETSFHSDNIVYAASGNNIYKSTNRGTTWTDISGNLPNIPMFSVVLDKNSPEGLYVGTDAGIYYKDSLMTNWMLYNTNLPVNSEFRDLEIVYDTVCTDKSVLFAATYGRGLWKGDLYITETQPNPNFTIPANACSGVAVPITNTTTSITNNGAATSYQWTITPATVTYTNGTSNTHPNPEVIFNNPGNYTISLKAMKPYGGFCTITKPNIITVGTGGMIVLKSKAADTICPGDTVLIQVGGLKTYTFTPNTEITPFQDSNAYAFPTTDIKYKIVGSINGGCFDSTYVDIKMKPFPAHSNTGNRILCNGDSTVLNFTGVDTAYFTPMTYVTSISPLSKKIVPAASQSYSVRMVKAGLCDVKLVIPIKVKPIPVFNLNKTGTQTLCLGDSLLVRELNSIPNKVWSPTNNYIAINNDTTLFKPVVNTKYYLHTTDTGYCNTTLDSISFNVVSVPTIVIKGATVVCGGATVQLIASGATTYAWSPNTYLSSITKDTVSSTPTSSIVYTVVGSNGTCSSSATHTINVGTGSISLKYIGDTNVCTGNSARLIASGATTYRWVPGNLVSNEFDDTVKISTNTSINLKLYGETVGCKDSMTIPIHVRPLPSMSYLLSSSNPICEGEKLTVKISGSQTYSIDPLYNVTKLKNDSFELNPRVTTKYYLFATSQYNCSAKDSATIVVNPLPIVTISPSISTIDRGNSIAITASGGSNYEWTPNKYITSSNTISTIQSQPDSDIVYKVKVTSSAGCVSNGIAIVYVLQKNKPSGIQASDLQNILIYPNPASESIQIESSEIVKASMYQLTGRFVQEFNQQAKKMTLDISHIATGNYILILENQNGVQKMAKIEIIR